MIMEKCRNPRQREFYIRMTAKFGWTKNFLAIGIQDQTYEKTLLGQNNFNETPPDSISPKANWRCGMNIPLIFWNWVKPTVNGRLNVPSFVFLLKDNKEERL